MKWKIPQLQQADAAQLPPFVLIYGEDGGKTKQLAKACAEKVCSDLSDPFQVDRIRVEDLLEDPTKLVDSVNTLMMTGGTRLVYVEGVNAFLTKQQLDTVTEAVSFALERLSESAVVVLSAAGIDAKHALPKMVEKHPQAAAIRCFVSSTRDIQSEVRTYFSQKGKKVSAEAVQFLTENLGNDRDITERELEVLDLYVGEQGHVSLDDCIETISSAPSLNVFKLCDAIGMRNREKVDYFLRVLSEEGQDINMVYVTAIRHMRRLMTVKVLVENGSSMQQALKELSPPVFYGQDIFIAQVNAFPSERIKTMIDKLYETLLQSRQGTLTPDLVMHRSILSLS